MADEIGSPYHGPAGGAATIKAIDDVLAEQGLAESGRPDLLHMNQHDGFVCPSCAWPEPRRHRSDEHLFCENGSKAFAWEATTRRCTPEFFAAHTVAELTSWGDYELELEGRLTHPMAYDPASDKYTPIVWEEAFARIGAALQSLDRASQAEFYTSGRTSNEAAFLYQLFGREFGTNNFPDCSNMCHEATSVGLPVSIGIGKGTVCLEDFDLADAIFIFGQNPGTNSPRMMSRLRNASRRGAVIVSFNPFRERALEVFAAPEDHQEVATGQGTPISRRLLQVRVGGDVAALKGIMKALLAMDEAPTVTGRNRVLDWDFIREHTAGLESLLADLRATSWDAIVRVSGLSQLQLEEIAQFYAAAHATVFVYGMGITQHRRGTETVQCLVNLALLRGNIGRAGAGICPVRGHSNVQGDRSMGIWEKPPADMLDRLRDAFGFEPPRDRGHDTVVALEAMVRGEARAFIGLGGNFATAVPDTPIIHAAMRRLDLTVQVSTKLNRGHLVHGRQAFILPCLGRTERDFQATGVQRVTVEDSMSVVKSSGGINPPASEHLLSEPAIVAGIARATLGQRSKVAWEWLVADYSRIRDKIAAVFPLFEGYNERLKDPDGFTLANTASERIWNTPSGRANFVVFSGLDEDEPEITADIVWLTTMRSHDQFNTTLYSRSDRYRGIKDERMVLFVGESAMQRQGFAAGDLVDVETVLTDRVERVVKGFRVQPYQLPDGCCGAYFPEANPLMPLYLYDAMSHTPSAKGIPVRLRRTSVPAS